ncbi:E3 ubiquitin-protein ligase BOI-like isoform X2 [Zingiber officinale]|uniref:E3 ubiquitin-protein ligase BOI-like isoform X2 n=1 Tax=Zingiber officinale TaxID=94328 RepID=UPI001C4D4FDA|nr:E3 ubiquitin-protein ligase BOI-like isoform X2 [Zingiber officinale]
MPSVLGATVGDTGGLSCRKKSWMRSPSKSMFQPFEQPRQQEVFPSSSAPAFHPTPYLLDQSLLLDMTISVASLMQTYQGEMHQFVQLQNQRLVQTLLEQRNQHVESLLNNFQAKVAVLLKAKDDELTIAMMRQQELQEKLKTAEESKAMWESIAKQNEAQILSLRTVLQQIQQPQFSTNSGGAPISISSNSRMEVKKEMKPTKDGNDKIILPCKCCGSRNACQLLLPCRHLCTCKQCTDSLTACPVCSSKIAVNSKVLL